MLRVHALGIDIDTEGDVYVITGATTGVQKFTADGRFLMQFGASGSGEGEFNRPTGIAVDQADLCRRLEQRLPAGV